MFFSIYSFGMKPKPGKYKIKIKVNKISPWDPSYLNVIGVKADINKGYMHWYNVTYDYIGWSSYDGKDNTCMVAIWIVMDSDLSILSFSKDMIMVN